MKKKFTLLVVPKGMKRYYMSAFEWSIISEKKHSTEYFGTVQENFVDGL